MNTASLERLYPDSLDQKDATGVDTYRLHMERYEFAATYLQGRVLDMACGVGYGTWALAQANQSQHGITGVDISAEAIAYAQNRYVHAKVKFIAGDAHNYRESDKFDTVVSLETFEHLPEPDRFLDNLVANVLRAGGTLICSSPVTPSVDANPYHLHDFTAASFRKAFTSRGFVEVAAFRQKQPFNPWKIVNKTEVRTHDLRSNLLGFYYKNPRKLLARIWSTLRFGFNNHYLTIVWRLPA